LIAESLLAELRGLGVVLRVAGDRLRYSPADAVTREIRDRMVRCKPMLIALVLAEGPAKKATALGCGGGDSPSKDRCPSCHQPDFVRPQAGGLWRCARCEPYDPPSAEIEWWPQIVGPLVLLDEPAGGVER